MSEVIPQIPDKLSTTEKDFWKKELEAARKWMQPKHELWRSLLNQYSLKYDFPHLNEDQIVAISSFHPKSRQLIASIAFNHPKLFFTVEDQAEALAAQLLERASNAALDLMEARQRVQQAIFYALFCNVGWIDLGFNPPGDQDTELPYVVNDSLQQDFTYLRAPSPFDVYIDPLTPPDNVGASRYIFEDMWVPMEFLKRDARFEAFHHQLQPSVTADERDDLGEDFGGEEESKPEFQEWRQSLENGNMVRLTRIHDRIHKKRITMARGVDEAIEVIDHPFARQRPRTIPDPITGQPLIASEEMELGDGFLVGNGFQLYPLRFDATDGDFYGLPMMAYAEDTQRLQVESVSRRSDILMRTPRVTKLNKDAVASDPQITDKLKNPKDGDHLLLDDIHNDIAPMDWGALPVDQLGLEADARRYEDQIMQTAATVGGSNKKTATAASLEAAFGELNREWLQSKVADCYEWIIRSSFNIFGDPRYCPDKFILNVAGPNQQPVYQAVKADLFVTPFRIRIHATSMQPMIEQLEQEKALAMFQHLIQIPEVDRTEAIKSLLQAFNKEHELDRFLKTAAHADATKLAQLENNMLMQGQQVAVQLEEDHQTHLPIHQQGMRQLAAQFQQIQASIAQGVIPPQAAQLTAALQQFQAHTQAHQQAEQQLAAPTIGGGGGATSELPSYGNQTGTGIQDNAQELIGLTRSNAQEVSQAINVSPGQN